MCVLCEERCGFCGEGVGSIVAKPSCHATIAATVDGWDPPSLEQQGLISEHGASDHRRRGPQRSGAGLAPRAAWQVMELHPACLPLVTLLPLEEP